MGATQYHPITCKSAVNRVTGMPFNWSLNPYRGCVHACHYCYARATHTYFGLNADEDFERPGAVRGSTQALANPPHHNPTVKPEILAWVRGRAARDLTTADQSPMEA